VSVPQQNPLSYNQGRYAPVILALMGLAIAALVLCAPVFAKKNKDKKPGKELEGYREVADLHVVDCLLPGQVRRLGNRTYLTARRPIKTTASDCRIRGGEYVEFDRADYKTALNVWLPAAEAGDTDAQNTVGEIFERGLGGEPNYAAALIWYRKAAAQNNTRAQFNLGTLYEQGFGVEANQLEALNWYRRAWGIGEDDLMFASAAARETAELREQLAAAVKQKNQQVELLRKQLDTLKKQLAESAASAEQAALETQTLQGLISQLEDQAKESAAQLAQLPPPSASESAVAAANGPKTREPLSSTSAKPALPVLTEAGARQRSYKKLKLGRYFALLIGNADYTYLENLDTPRSDIARAEKVLRDKYGFKVFKVSDGDNIAVMQAINDLNKVLKPEDNLLLFYAGHGSRLSQGKSEVGYWLPTNAEQPPRNTYWVPNEFVTGHLARLQAKRVLVVADSCYAGLLSREPSFLLLGQNEENYANQDFLEFKLAKKSRLLLTSGGDRPVLDGGGDGSSVFARAFLDELEGNKGLLSSPGLFLRIRDRVEALAKTASFDQRPEFKTIKTAGHEVGDFFFLPKSLK